MSRFLSDEQIAALVRYVQFVVTDGDPLNDYLTYFSGPFHDVLFLFGTFVSVFTG